MWRNRLRSIAIPFWTEAVSIFSVWAPSSVVQVSFGSCVIHALFNKSVSRFSGSDATQCDLGCHEAHACFADASWTTPSKLIDKVKLRAVGTAAPRLGEVGMGWG